MKSTSESLLSFAESELIHKDTIRAAVLSEAPQKQKKPVAWTKILLPIAASLVLLCATVLAIPEARAEVFSWFTSGRIADYLGTAPENRTPVPALDELIVPPADTSVLPTAPKTAPETEDAPLGSITDNRILQVCDEPIWQEIARDFSVEIGETMFDGNSLYIGVTFNGLCALPETVQHVGGSETAVRVPFEELEELFQGHVPDDYAKDDVSWWESSEGALMLQLPNGVYVFAGHADLFAGSSNPAFEELINTIIHTYGTGIQTDAKQEEISKTVIEWLQNQSLHAVTELPIDSIEYGYTNWKTDSAESIPIDNKLSYLTEQADENGILNAKLLYVSAGETSDTFTTFLAAEIGTVCVDLNAYRRLPLRTLEAKTPLRTLPAQSSVISIIDSVKKAGQNLAAVTNRKIDLQGVTFETKDGATIDGLGVHNILVQLTLPNEWTADECNVFCSGLRFYAEIQDARYTVESRATVQTLHSITYMIQITRLPRDRIDSFENIRLVPYQKIITELSVGGTVVPLELNKQMTLPNETAEWNTAWIELSDGILTYTIRS